MFKMISKFIPVFKEKINETLNDYSPDLIIIIARKGARFIDKFALIPNEFTDRIIFSEAIEYGAISIEGKKILIIDDTISHGTTLLKIREQIEPLATVRSLVLVRNRDRYEAGQIEEVFCEVCVDLNSREFHRFLNEVSEFFGIKRESLDVDHFSLSIISSNLEELYKSIIDISVSIGTLSLIPTPRNSNSICLSLCTSDESYLFPTRIGEHMRIIHPGIQKLRFYLDFSNNTLTIVPILFPVISFDTSISEASTKNYLGCFQTVAEKICQQDIDELTCSKAIYSLISLKSSVECGLDFLARISQNQNSIQISYNQEDIKRLYGNNLGTDIIRNIDDILQNGNNTLQSRISTVKPLFPIDTCTAPIEKTCSNLFSVSIKMMEKAQEYQDNQPTIRNRIDRGLSIHDYYAMFPTCDHQFINPALDTLIDRGILKPILQTTIIHSNIEIARTFRPGEPLEDFEHKKNKTISMIYYTLWKAKNKYHLSTRGMGLASLLFYKLIDNLYHDWWNFYYEKLSLILEPRLYGYVPAIENPITYESESLLSYFSEDTYISITKDKDKYYYDISDQWEPSLLYQYMSPSDVDSLDGLLEIYCLIAKHLGGSTGELMTLANLRNEYMAYEVAHKQVVIWYNEIRRCFFSWFPSKTTVLQEVNLDNNIVQSTRPYQELLKKIAKFQKLNQTINKLEDSFENHPRQPLVKGIIQNLTIPETDAAFNTLKHAALIMQHYTTLVRGCLTVVGLCTPKKGSKREEYVSSSLEEIDILFQYADADLSSRLRSILSREKMDDLFRKEEFSKIRSILQLSFDVIYKYLINSIMTPELYQYKKELEYKMMPEKDQHLKIFSEEIKERNAEGYIVVVDIIKYLDLDENERIVSREKLIQESMKIISKRQYSLFKMPMHIMGADGIGLFFKNVSDAFEYSRVIFRQMDDPNNPANSYPVGIGITFNRKDSPISNDGVPSSDDAYMAWMLANSYPKGSNAQILISEDAKNKLDDVAYSDDFLETIHITDLLGEIIKHSRYHKDNMIIYYVTEFRHELPKKTNKTIFEYK